MPPIVLRPLLFLLFFGLPVSAWTQDQPAASPAVPAVNFPPSVAAAVGTFAIAGTVRSGKTSIPGVTVTAANTLTGKKYVAATSLTGSFTLSGLARGRYVVRVEFLGFAPQTQEALLNTETPIAKLDFEILLASRAQQQESQASSFQSSGRGFQSLGMDGGVAGADGIASTAGFNGGQGTNSTDLSALPMNGASADVPTESVSVSGAMGRTQDFGGGSEDDIQERMREFRDRAQREGGGFGGGQGGPGGGPGGGGPGGSGGGGGGPFTMRMPRGFNINQPHGTLFLNSGDSIFDARPYALSGTPQPRANYNQQRFGAFLGGPLKIPNIWDGSKKNFFFLGWNGSRGSNPYDASAVVPTVEQRNGNFLGLVDNQGNPIQLYDPQTGLPIANNQITTISPQAASLLQFIPMPNQSTGLQNFHYVTSTDSTSDSFMFRLVHNFGAGGGPGFGPFGGGGGGGRGGGNRAQNNLNFGGNYTRSSNHIAGAFPSLAGNSGTQGLNANAGYAYGKGKITNNLRFNYNHNHAATSNLYSGIQDVAGSAGINGVSPNPFDWNIPSLSFTSFTGLNSPAALRRLDQTFTISDSIGWNRGKHNWRFGGDYRRILQSFRAARNAEGNFTFTGFASGYDFADFLLGLPALTTIQSGTDSYDFRANSYDFFSQDDWRIRSNVTLNLGIRYEYNGPFSEEQNHISNLDIAPGFTAVAPVLPGQTGTYSGAFPAGLINPDRNNWAPRIGIAWKPQKQTVVRAGYGINYNLGQYGSIIQNFAFQPPFALTETNSSNLASPLTLANGFPAPTAAVTNNFAADKNYRLGYVQLWNLDIQRELRWGMALNIGYNGAKGSNLDMLRAPNRNPDGSLRISGVQPFLFESSEAHSIFHAATIRARKRMGGGVSLSGSYVFSKSLDNASSIGGGGAVVAQNDQDLAAERGPSSFDQRHRFTGNWIFELPFGAGKRLFQTGSISHVLGGWQWSGDFTIASGSPLTVRVLGGVGDISTGVNGTLRSNVVPGQPFYLSDPTTKKWFNTAAFAVPATGTFGDAGRNILYGPSQVSLNMAISKTIQIKDSRVLELRVQANNVFNRVQFASISTIVNSQTFGEVTGTGGMRKLTIVTRFRF